MEWKKCVYDETVEISDQGRVRKKLPLVELEDGTKCDRAYRYLTPYMYGNYLHVNFNNQTYMLHRLVAEHFIDNPKCLPILKFKDGNVLNVNSTNLEWCTRSDRMKEILCSRNYKLSSGKSKRVYCEETDMTYPNIRICAAELKKLDDAVNYDTLTRRLRKSNSTHYLKFHIKLKS